MTSKTSSRITSLLYPSVGTIIDDGALQLTEVLSMGVHSGVVYRAIDTRQPAGQKTYAVRCLYVSVLRDATQHQRQIHMQGIKLHQLTSAHPGVVTLHRVVEQGNHIYIIMEYAPDRNLSTQIFQTCLYLGNNALIKDIFLQLIDAVEYCHSFGIYHRDLKLQNIVCFEDGFRVAITGFVHATVDRLSNTFCIGDAWYMSPESQGKELAPAGRYSPRFNDVWSLGIILLHIITGRNPWESATPEDPTFQVYMSDPLGFLISFFPISSEVNDILVGMLHIDWRERSTLHEVRTAVEEITNFYSDDVIFQGYMAYQWPGKIEHIHRKSSATKKNLYPGSSIPVPPVNVASNSATMPADIQPYVKTATNSNFDFPVEVSLDTRPSTLHEQPITVSPSSQKNSHTGTVRQAQTANFAGPQPIHLNDSTPSIQTFYSNPHSSIETFDYGIYYTRHAISQDSMVLVGY